MATYCVLYQFMGQLGNNVKDVPQGIEQVHQTVADLGGKVLACYLLMGEYDSVGIYELPSDEAALTLLLGIANQGMVKTTSLKAFAPEEVAQIVQRLP